MKSRFFWAGAFVSLMAAAPACGFHKRSADSPETIPSPSLPQIQVPAPVIPSPPAPPLPPVENVTPSPTTPDSSPDSPAPAYPPGDIK
ncbi:MAG TPA: hypothetical protein VFX30_06850 [bacterium]|nr:hypothetical protein [bacterium]